MDREEAEDIFVFREFVVLFGLQKVENLAFTRTDFPEGKRIFLGYFRWIFGPYNLMPVFEGPLSVVSWYKIPFCSIEGGS